MDGEEREGKKQIEDETTGELGEDADDEESEDTSPLLGMVEVRESPHGGLGVFALRDFEKGEVVLREIPFMALRELPWEDVEQRLDHDSESSQRIRQAAEELATDTSALFWSFTQTDLYGDVKTPQGVFWTNMIELYTEPDSSNADEQLYDGVSCMFEITSRLNHSCSPSVEWVSFAAVPALESVAVRGIKQGDEVFVSYKTGGGHEDTLERREYLAKWYGFRCRCRHCKAYLDRYNLKP